MDKRMDRWMPGWMDVDYDDMDFHLFILFLFYLHETTINGSNFI